MTDPPTFKQKWGDDFFSSRGFIQFPSAQTLADQLGRTPRAIQKTRLGLPAWALDKHQAKLPFDDYQPA